MLFALPFAAVGAGSGVWLVKGIVDHHRMQRWQETPATIVWTKLESHSDSDGTTHKATAEYTYQYRGRSYTGRRVALGSGSDNVGSFQEDAHRQLTERRRSGRPFRCYVNPDDPSDAILFRDLRTEMIVFKAGFTAAFGLGGFGMLALGAWGYRKSKSETALAAAHPDEPWLWKRQWVDGRINSSSGMMAVFATMFALLWNSITWPILYLMLGEMSRKPNAFALFFLLFPVVGVLLLVWAAVAVLRLRKYGRSVFEMESVPGVIGGQLAGVIRTSAKVRAEEGFRLALCCVEKTTSGDNSSEKVLWQSEQLIARELLRHDPRRSAIPVLFQIPYDCRPTESEPSEYRQATWRLEVSAKTRGFDFSTSFEVPVFKTAASDPNFIVDPALLAKYSAPEDPERDLREARLVKMRSPTGEGFRLVFPMARTPVTAGLLTLVACVFTAVPAAMFYAGAPWWVDLIGGTFFGLIGLALVAASADLWFYRSTVDVSPAGLSIVGGLFGRGRPKWIAAEGIERIELASNMSFGAGEGQKVYYDVKIVVTAGKKITAGKRVLGKRLAESVVRQIEAALTEPGRS
jgi:hypothetical protein